MDKPSVASVDAEVVALTNELRTKLLSRLRALENVRVYAPFGSRLMSVSTFAPGTKQPRLYTPPLLAAANSIVSIESHVCSWIASLRENLRSLGSEYMTSPALVMIPSLVPLVYKKYRAGPDSSDSVALLGGFQLQIIRQCEVDSLDVYENDGTYGKHQAAVNGT